VLDSLYPKKGKLINGNRILFMESQHEQENQSVKKYFVNIEGTEYEWNKGTMLFRAL